MKLDDAYRNFFIGSPEGQEFMKMLDQMIDAFHEAAEKTDDSNRPVYKAAGVREVKNHIISVTTPKRGVSM